MNPIYNFSAGPAMIPKEVLQQAASEMLDWNGSGMSVMEMSHRGPEFTSIYERAQADLRELLAVPSNYHILFLQGGAMGENAIVPMNLIGPGQFNANEKRVADYVYTGIWSGKSISEAQKYAKVNVVASSEAEQFSHVPDVSTWALSSDAAYLHYCSNETIGGVEFQEPPALKQMGYTAPLVADMSSQILSRVIDVNDYGVIYGGAQKNIGPAGLTIVIVRDDLLNQALDICPTAFHWRKQADNQSMINTPATYAIYIAGLVFQWLKKQGGVAAIEKVNQAKAELLYRCIDTSSLYENRIQVDVRSRMNIPFFLKDERLNPVFLERAKQHGLLQLRGHKVVGGMRASIYNAMPLEGVQALVEFMQDFEKNHG